MRQRIVIDTNVYVSTFIRPDSIPARAVEKEWQQAQTLVSLETWTELRIVLNRPKLARYVKPDLLDPFLRNVWAAAEPIVIAFPIRACRDPRDDKFLEVAVHGRADVIVTGDVDLLTLHPFQGISILTPAEYLERK
jgi:putative PIN family toxin of toxin-antitoxin system